MESTKQCPKCHTENPTGANFCRHCRYEFPEETKKGHSIVPTISHFKIRENDYCEGSTIHLEWEVSHATSLSLCGEDVTNTNGCEYKINRNRNLKLVAKNEYTSVYHELKLIPKEIAVIKSLKSNTEAFNVGESVILTWKVTNARTIIIQSNGTKKDVTGKSSIKVKPTKSTEYTLVAFSYDKTLFSEQKIILSARPQIKKLAVLNNMYCEGSLIRIGWETENADKTTLNGNDVTGTYVCDYAVSKNNHSIRLVVKSGNLRKEKSLKLMPSPCAKIVHFTPSSYIVAEGQEVKLKWDVRNAARIILKSDQFEYEVTKLYSYIVKPSETTEYTLVAYSCDETVKYEENVKIEVICKVEITKFESDQLRIAEGNPITLSWNVKNADHIEILPLCQDVTGRNNITLHPKSDTEYQLVAYNQMSRKEAYICIGVQQLPKIKVDLLDPLSSMQIPNLSIDLSAAIGSIKDVSLDRWISAPDEQPVSKHIWNNRVTKKLKELLKGE